MTPEELRTIKIISAVKQDHPEANWIAIDKCGLIWSYENKPMIRTTCWTSGIDISTSVISHDNLSDNIFGILGECNYWKESLIEIPKK